MAALAQAQRDELHGRLEHERAALRAQIDEIENEDVKAENQYDSEFSGYGNHMAETASETFEQERNLALEQSFKTQLSEVEHALNKLADGTYGRCDNCGRDIALERLQALPQAALCVTCKERRETQRH